MTDTNLRWAVNVAEWQPSDDRLQAVLNLLPASEQQAVARFTQADDRKRSLVSRLMQRACASQVLGLPWNKVDIQRTKGNKPYISNTVHRPNARNFNYNVSHEGSYVVLASDPLCVIGCDISAPRVVTRAQTQKTTLEWLQSFRPQLTDDEWAMVEAAGPSESDMETVFRQYWCCKEAFVKARGDGIAFDLKRVGFQIAAAGRGQPLAATVLLDSEPQPE